MKEYISPSGLHLIVDQSNDCILEHFRIINNKTEKSRLETPIKFCNTIFGTLENTIKVCSLKEVFE
jgi:hypothetical protein